MKCLEGKRAGRRRAKSQPRMGIQNRKVYIIQKSKKLLINRFNIKIEYLECRNLMTLTKNLNNKPFKLFIAYYLNNVRLIDNF